MRTLIFQSPNVRGYRLSFCWKCVTFSGSEPRLHPVTHTVHSRDPHRVCGCCDRTLRHSRRYSISRAPRKCLALLSIRRCTCACIYRSIYIIYIYIYINIKRKKTITCTCGTCLPRHVKQKWWNVYKKYHFKCLKKKKWDILPFNKKENPNNLLHLLAKDWYFYNAAIRVPWEVNSPFLFSSITSFPSSHFHFDKKGKQNKNVNDVLMLL